MRFEKILLCIDNGRLSDPASRAALSLAQHFDAPVVGIHVYNAAMHERAFRLMEPILPAQYQQEEILQKQRQLHGELINRGMEKISHSYLKPVADLFNHEAAPFRTQVREGKNCIALNRLLAEEGGDLVVMGTVGFNHESEGFIGSVCLRALRKVERNFLFVREQLSFQNPVIVVALDGSEASLTALKAAALFADIFDAGIHLLYVFDSNIHKDIFGKLKESLINDDSFSFNSRDQEKIHDAFIDRGLAQIGALLLEKAEDEVLGPLAPESVHAAGWGPVGEGRRKRCVKKILDGHVYKMICSYAREIAADLVFVGRTGRHFAEGMDVGSVTENVVRYAPCSVFVAAGNGAGPESGGGVA